MPERPARPRPDFRFEAAAQAAGARCIAGLDEVGRGPWAGPVLAAAVVLDPARLPADLAEGLDDSKRLSPKRRAALAEAIRAVAPAGLGAASVAEIDRLNILQASHLAMRRALADLALPVDFCLIDGNRMPGDLPCPARLIVGGDGLSLSIAAASIVAKVARDALMVDLAQQFPAYGWQHNMGYGTATHRQALQMWGVTPHHRRSFAPIHKLLWQDISASD